MVKSNLDDWTLYYGRGAGRLPTAATMIGDIAEAAARNLAAGAASVCLGIETSKNP